MSRVASVEARVVSIVGEVGEIAAAGGDWRSALAERAVALCGARQGVLGEVENWRRGTPRPGRVIAVGMDDEGRKHFLRYLAEPDIRDPFLDAIVSGPPSPRVVGRRDVVDDGMWYDSVFVNEFRRPAGVDDIIMAVAPPAPGTTDVSLSVHRGTGERPFGREEIVALSTLQRAMAGWVHLLLARERPAPPLTPRLAQTLALLQQGLSERQAALRMGVSQHTVHLHVKRLYRWFGVHSRAELLVATLGGGRCPPAAGADPRLTGSPAGTGSDSTRSPGR